jgi:hypothetical protein
MSWEAVGALAELAGGIGVIVTLVYLAVQIRQNTQSQRNENYARAVDRVASIQARMSEDGAFAGILLRGTQDIQSLSASERVQFTWAFYEMFGGFEYMYHQEKQAALASEVWSRWADTLQWWLCFPGVQAWWDARPAPFAPDFTRFVESRRSLGPPDPEAHRRWREFLAGRS